MTSKQGKVEYLTHHLSYELLMLRFTHARLHNTKHKLEWNAFLESFAVHARNLQFFLMNDKDSRNRRAEDYNPAFQASKPPVEIKDKIAVYVVHPGKARSKEGSDKFNLERADKALPWIEKEFARFLEQLPENERHWDPRLADPRAYQVDQSGEVPVACTHPGFASLSVNQTHTSHIEQFVWQFPPNDK